MKKILFIFMICLSANLATSQNIETQLLILDQVVRPVFTVDDLYWNPANPFPIQRTDEVIVNYQPTMKDAILEYRLTDTLGQKKWIWSNREFILNPRYVGQRR